MLICTFSAPTFRLKCDLLVFLPPCLCFTIMNSNPLKLCCENQHWNEDKTGKEMIIIATEEVLSRATPTGHLILKCTEKDKSHWKLQEGSCWGGSECFHIKIMGFGQTENPEQHHCWITLWLGDQWIVMCLSAMPQDTGSLQVYLRLIILSWWLLWVWLNLKMPSPRMQMAEPWADLWLKHEL